MQIEVHTIETEVLMYETLLIKAGKFFSRPRRHSERGLLRIFLITFQQAAVPGRMVSIRTVRTAVCMLFRIC